jgi:DHA1 family bicyclomycin/chloramphenicol resistance-like MFS transporter
LLLHDDSTTHTTTQPRRAGQTPSPITGRLLVVLALLAALAPFATDMYLPAFPAMTVDLGASATQVQLTLTAMLLGIAIGQLVFGPVSDRYGRLRPLVVGAALCVVASAVAASAPTVAVLVGARFVQGLTGAAGMVIGRAMITDLTTGKTAARAFSLMMVVSGIAPVVAPFVGSLLVGPIGWRGVLWVLFAVAATMFVSILAFVRESLPARRRERAEVAGASGSPVRALTSRAYLANTVTFAFSFAVMMAYISASPFVYQVMIGMNEVQYGIAFGVNALGLVGSSALSARLTYRYPVGSVLRAGLALMVVATIALLLIVVSGAPVALLPIPIFVAVASVGLVVGNATALALSEVPAAAAGVASALLGALQFGLAAVISPLVSIGGENTALPLAVCMLAAAVVALAAHLTTHKPATSER